MTANDFLKKVIKKNEFIFHQCEKVIGFYRKYCISDEDFVRKKFKKSLGRDLELDNPVKYNDKLQWLKLNWYDPLAALCADKYEVRNYVKEQIGEQYLTELYGVYNSVDEIDVDALPDAFALKATHGSGFNIICKDKHEMDLQMELKKMKRWLNKNYYWRTREWVYKDIPPRIICERFLEQPETGELFDYKIFCFSGKPKIIMVNITILNEHRRNTSKRNIYDINWNLIEAEISYSNAGDVKIDKPKKLELMLNLSEKLSLNFPHARIDFYYIQDKIHFGEITFFHRSGFAKIVPEEFEIKLGNWLELPSNDHAVATHSNNES